MIDLALGESAAGSLKLAKAIKRGDPMNDAVAIIGGSWEQRQEAQKPRVWQGETMDGDSRDVLPLTLALDIGSISDMDIDMDLRRQTLELLFGDYDGVAKQLFFSNMTSLASVKEALRGNEKVRLWVCESDPSEMCALRFICHLARTLDASISIVRVPQYVQSDNTITQYGSTGEIAPEDFGRLVPFEHSMSMPEIAMYAAQWTELVSADAPLRAIVNGRLMGVPKSFYDYAIRANIPGGEFRMAQLIGKTLSQLNGVGDRWLYLRICHMLSVGELIEVAPKDHDHPYSAVLKRGDIW